MIPRWSPAGQARSSAASRAGEPLNRLIVDVAPPLLARSSSNGSAIIVPGRLLQGMEPSSMMLLLPDKTALPVPVKPHSEPPIPCEKILLLNVVEKGDENKMPAAPVPDDFVDWLFENVLFLRAAFPVKAREPPLSARFASNVLFSIVTELVKYVAETLIAPPVELATFSKKRFP